MESAYNIVLDVMIENEDLEPKSSMSVDVEMIGQNGKKQLKMK